jgi:hypothetical protein
MKIYTGLSAIATLPSYVMLSLEKTAKDYRQIALVVERLYALWSNIDVRRLMKSDFKYVTDNYLQPMISSCLDAMRSTYLSTDTYTKFVSPDRFEDGLKRFWKYPDFILHTVDAMDSWQGMLFGYDADFNQEHILRSIADNLDLGEDITWQDVIASIPSLTKQQGLEIDTKDFVNVLLYLKLVFELKPKFDNLQRRLATLPAIHKTWMDQRERDYGHLTRGTLLKAPSNDIETLYHVSLFANAIAAEGFLKETPKTGDRYGLGAFGDSPKISFTSELRVATEISRYFKESWSIIHGHYRWPQIIAMLRKDAHGLDINALIKATSYSISHDVDTTHPIDVYYVYDRALSSDKLKFRSNPLVIYKERFITVLQKLETDKGIGIVEAQVNMNHDSVEFVSSLSEVRAAPDAVVKIVRKI